MIVYFRCHHLQELFIQEEVVDLFHLHMVKDHIVVQRLFTGLLEDKTIQRMNFAVESDKIRFHHIVQELLHPVFGEITILLLVFIRLFIIIYLSLSPPCSSLNMNNFLRSVNEVISCMFFLSDYGNHFLRQQNTLFNVLLKWLKSLKVSVTGWSFKFSSRLSRQTRNRPKWCSLQ